jgi:cold shock protein
MDGVIVRLNGDKGFGFIKGDDGLDRFFHKSGLERSTLRFDELEQNMRVAFTHVDGDKGPRAIEVRVV